MDEPCSALDPTSTRRIEETIAELAAEVTIVIVTHNMQQAARVSDQCAFFLAEQGTPGRDRRARPDRRRCSRRRRTRGPTTTSTDGSAEARAGTPRAEHSPARPPVSPQGHVADVQGWQRPPRAGARAAAPPRHRCRRAHTHNKGERILQRLQHPEPADEGGPRGHTRSRARRQRHRGRPGRRRPQAVHRRRRRRLRHQPGRRQRAGGLRQRNELHPVQSTDASQAPGRLLGCGRAPTCITPKAPGATFLRPNGSTNGRKALSRAIDGTGWGNGTDCGGNKAVTGLVQFARSSAGPSGSGTDLTYIPFGRDGMSFGYYAAGVGSPVTTLTSAQLTSLFTDRPADDQRRRTSCLARSSSARAPTSSGTPPSA